MTTQLIGLSLVIQAGGLSERMGSDKGLVGFHGQPLVQRIAERLSAIADEILIATNNDKAYRFLGIPLANDLKPGTGALGGLYTALSAARHPAVAVVACDMPFVNAALLKHQHNLMMALDTDLVIPRSVNGLEPFHAIYRRKTCLPQVRNALNSEKRRVDSWLGSVNIYYVEPDEYKQFDPNNLAFLNVNTFEELYTAEQLDRDLS